MEVPHSLPLLSIQDDPLPRRLSDNITQEITQQATIFRRTSNQPLSDFQLRVNEAAIELALAQPSLIRKRGELLENARKKVADDGYCFKKGKSRSKVYGSSDDPPTTSKRPKLDQTMREDRIKDLEEDIADISSHIAFKEKRRMQAETVKNYKTCDELTQEILECKGRKRELEKQLKLLLLKDKRSKRRKNRLQESDSRSRSTTPMLTTPPTPQTPSSPLSPTWVQLSDKEEVTRSSTPSTTSIIPHNICGESSSISVLMGKSSSDESDSHFFTPGFTALCRSENVVGSFVNSATEPQKRSSKSC